MSVTAAQGFRAAGVAAGLKPSGRPDVALVVNEGPRHDAAAVFTSNRVEAAPVSWSRQVLSDGRCDTVILNSGGANACTGVDGFADTHRTAEAVAELVGVSAGDVAVCSTGLIGERLPMDTLLAGVDAAAGALSQDGGAAAAQAILTTDTVDKQAVRSVDGWTVGGMAKGAGMLAPALATMLVVITTDAVLPAPDLDAALRAAVETTFQRIDSDGCQSTNDTVLLLSSGASGQTPEAQAFTQALTEVCQELARGLIADAEGAKHDVSIQVQGAASVADGLEVARSVARSNLLKCAIFGGDPNWGRVVSAVGTTSATFEPSALDVWFNGIQVCRSLSVGQDRNLVDLSEREVQIVIDLHAGSERVQLWTNDLTHDYVHENSAYST
ncbi:bifunctional glutamate N-acetyltransferase/amino-acid acetyltransferase ArgJ [Dermacoccaceae bacterium W4C1]